MSQDVNHFCSQCGTPLHEGAKFCPNCGTPLNAGMAPKPSGAKRLPVVAVAAVLLLAVVLIISTGVFHKHEWSPATCDAPQTCSKCGKTEGDALGHLWVAATCTTPEICQRCGAEEGLPIGHIWMDATYDDPQTCALCGETQGEPLAIPYIEGHWESAKIKTGSSIFTISGWVFDRPMSLKKVNIAMNVSMNRGASCREWQLWGRVNGKYIVLGQIYLPNGDGYTEAEVEWSGYKTIDALAIAPTIVGGYSWTMNFLAWPD